MPVAARARRMSKHQQRPGALVRDKKLSFWVGRVFTGASSRQVCIS